MAKSDIDTLTGIGFSENGISDAAQVVSYFNYIKRIAEGLGVDLEDEMK
jgi:alkylhydroperoxidase family enzyme